MGTFKDDCEAAILNYLDHHPLLDQIESYLNWIRTAKALSENTVEAYQNDLRILLKQCIESGENYESLSLDFLKDFVVSQGELGYEMATVVRRIACLRSFSKYCVSEGWLEENWSEKLESPKIWKSLPDILSKDEIEKLLLACQSFAYPKRELAIVEMLYGLGLRVSELTSMAISNIRYEDRLLFVRGKGDKDRYVPIGECAYDALQNYLKNERALLLKKIGVKQKIVFLGDRGNPLSRQSIYIKLKNISKVAGLSKKVYPHILRHSYATHLLENGADLRVIQELLGHSDISTTERYTSVEISKIRRNFQNWHPRS